MDNGYGDYAIPRSLREKNGFQDYDMPLTRKEREAKERAMTGTGGAEPPLQQQPPPPPPPPARTMIRQDSGSDYDVPISREERQRREKGGRSILSLHPRSTVSDSSSDASRPVSVTSSVYSADTSSLSLNSSRSSSKLTLPKDDSEYDIPKPSLSTLPSQSSFDQQMEMIDQLVDDIAEKNAARQVKNQTTGAKEDRVGGGGGGGSELSVPAMPHKGVLSSLSAHSSHSTLDESSSNSGSNDGGVWDDVSDVDDSEESEGEHMCM